MSDPSSRHCASSCACIHATLSDVSRSMSLFSSSFCLPSSGRNDTTTARQHCNCLLSLPVSMPKHPKEGQGSVDGKSSRWLSLEITETDFPWVFMKERKPSLIISTLGALAVLLSLKVFFWRPASRGEENESAGHTHMDGQPRERVGLEQAHDYQISGKCSRDGTCSPQEGAIAQSSSSVGSSLGQPRGRLFGKR